MVEELETKSKNALDFIKFRQSREINGIPTKFKGPFSEIIPAWDQNTTTIIAGRTGEGKTSFTWQHAVIDVIDFIKEHPESKTKIYFVSLELKYTELYIKIFSTLLSSRFNKEYDRKVFLGLTEERLSQEEIDYIEKQCKPFLDLIDEHVTIVDTDKTPKELSVFLNELILEDEDIENRFVIVDTVNAMGVESGSNKQESMKEWNQELALKVFRNQLNCIVINIMQLDMESGKRQFNNNGINVFEKYVPTLESMGNDKESSRSASLVLSLFNPSTFGLEICERYKVAKFNNQLRYVYVLKSNFGGEGTSYPFVFHGKSNKWIEIIHSPEELDLNPELYLDYYGIKEPPKSSLANLVPHISTSQKYKKRREESLEQDN